MLEIIIVSDAVDGTSVDLDDEGVGVPKEDRRVGEVGLTGTSATADRRGPGRSCELGLTGTSATTDHRGPGRSCELGLTGTSATADSKL